MGKFEDLRDDAREKLSHLFGVVRYQGRQSWKELKLQLTQHIVSQQYSVKKAMQLIPELETLRQIWLVCIWINYLLFILGSKEKHYMVKQLSM